jgi:hypothetical protein
MFQDGLCGMSYALGMSRLPLLTGNHEHEIDIMNETIIPVKPATPTPCACATAAKAQPTTAPVTQPQPQAAAAPAPAAPKAGKRNWRKH